MKGIGFHGEAEGNMDLGKLISRFLFVVLCLAIAAPTFAIEKRKKDTPAQKKDTATAVTPKTVTEPTKDQVKPVDPPKKPPVFNDFIDVNRNGIDDRLEQGGFVVPSKRPPQQQQPAPSTKKTDTVKADAPKKQVVTPKVVEKKKDK